MKLSVKQLIDKKSTSEKPSNPRNTVIAVCLAVVTYFYVDSNQPLLKYLEYLPVYRAERNMKTKINPENRMAATIPTPTDIGFSVK